MKTRTLLVAAVSASVLGVCGVGALMAGMVGSDEPKQVVTTATPKPIQNPNSIGEGLWKVGTEVKAGTYRTKGAIDAQIPLCYWHTAKDDTDATIITQGLVDKITQQGRVTLKKGEFFKTSGCQEWEKVK
jgi:hypothetical protein